MNPIKLLFVPLVLISCAWISPAGYQLGDKVEDFTLKNVDDKMISLSDFSEEKGVILVFDCNTCPVSNLYNDRIMALNKKFSPLGYPVIAINSNDPVQSPGDSFKNMKAYASEKNYTHPYLFDEDQTIARAFGATNTPHTYVLENVGGNFIVKYIGAIDNNARDGNSADKKYVENAVNSLLNGEKPEIQSTRAIGCSIKWKNS